MATRPSKTPAKLDQKSFIRDGVNFISVYNTELIFTKVRKA
ncbi:hypothetical protein CbuK_1529 [Coxiella burnetii CbuK_Q154]|uniref:Uncharacterized protein n=1 Tax=Coxiella burnetii (strain Dugway 5J108-111) TaxID=434922 RepID=A9KDR5_COXBN|nr:hypothetical protein CBUD_0740 [Coxiella burnetii Dugway 5J108-111]ABX78149.1 hypothetical protein COXBURSA331_A1225 [Coxiella burnetii RSA 331]ACJ18599.1 hypothetical protein CbuG_1277 [Coxiella burnetii CbuG_Q212]ACJ20691.1 hypothetical protein CbuK_1529 [Coxiella burnetii CbuK_Q154]EDR36453.1 hypothetical protein COXBURSA334_0711 [Coxiella burnetii Q321]